MRRRGFQRQPGRSRDYLQLVFDAEVEISHIRAEMPCPARAIRPGGPLPVHGREYGIRSAECRPGGGGGSGRADIWEGPPPRLEFELAAMRSWRRQRRRIPVQSTDSDSAHLRGGGSIEARATGGLGAIGLHSGTGVGDIARRRPAAMAPAITRKEAPAGKPCPCIHGWASRPGALKR
jgi:hypothetical protein